MRKRNIDLSAQQQDAGLLRQCISPALLTFSPISPGSPGSPGAPGNPFGPCKGQKKESSIAQHHLSWEDNDYQHEPTVEVFCL